MNFEKAFELGESEIRRNQKENQIQELLTKTGLSRYVMVPIPSKKNQNQYLIRLKPYLGFIEWQSNPNTPGILVTVDTSSKPKNIKKRFEHAKRMIEAELLSHATTLAYKEYKEAGYAVTDLAKMLPIIRMLGDTNKSVVEVIYLQKILVEMTEAMPAWFHGNGFVLDGITFSTFKYRCIKGDDPLLSGYIALNKEPLDDYLGINKDLNKLIKVNQDKLAEFKTYCEAILESLNDII